MGEPAPETLWDVLGADEPYTLAGAHDVVAVAAYTLGEGRYELREVGGARSVPASPDDPPEAWCDETFGCSARELFERTISPGRIAALRACIDGITLGGARERQRFERAMRSLPEPGDRPAYAAVWRRPGCADMDRRVREGLFTISSVPTFGVGPVDLPLPGRPSPPRRPVWELVFAPGKHPGDEYTIAGPHDVASVAVFMLGVGAYGLREVVREGAPRVTPPIPGELDDPWLETFGRSASDLCNDVLNDKVGALIDCLASLIVGTGAERDLYFVGLGVITDPMNRAAYEAGWRDGRRGSVDLCDEATDLAVKLEHLRPLGAGSPDPARPH